MRPELSFDDDNKQWELKTIGDFILQMRGGASLRPNDFTNKAGCEVIPKKAIVPNGRLILDKKNPTYCDEEFFKRNGSKIITKDFIVTTLRDLVPSGPSIGYIVEFSNETEYILAQGVYGFTVDNERMDRRFLIQFSNRESYRRTMKRIMVGSTQVHIRNKDFFNVKIAIPSLPEQKKIADFLSTVDKKIQALTRKKELLEKYKKGVMQKIFKQEIRFKREDGSDYGEWEEKPMKEICKINQGLQIAISNRFRQDGKNRHFYITNEFLKENSDKKYYIENPSESVKCNENDILMTRTGNTGQVVTNVNGAFHNNFFKINFDRDRVSRLFLFYYLKHYPTQCLIMRLAGTSTIPDLNHSDFYRIPIGIPNLEEQAQIANFLTALDDKINAVGNQIAKMRMWKKGLLQQMFV